MPSESFLGERKPGISDADDETGALTLDGRLEHVHRRTTDKAGDKDVDRVIVQILRGRDLQQLAFAHDGHTVTHRHCLDLVMGDIECRHSEPPL